MGIQAVFIGPILPTGEFRANLERIAPSIRLIEHAPPDGRTAEEHRRQQKACADELTNVIIAVRFAFPSRMHHAVS